MKNHKIVKKGKRGGCKVKSIVRAPKNKLMKISPDNYFYLNDGSVLKSLKELEVLLETIDPNLFSYHSNEYKNDFAVWVQDVFNNKKLATELRKAKSAQASLKVLKERETRFAR